MFGLVTVMLAAVYIPLLWMMLTKNPTDVAAGEEATDESTNIDAMTLPEHCNATKVWLHYVKIPLAVNSV